MPIASFAAYPHSFRGGVMVAVGDANGDGQPDIITGTGPLGTNEVRYFDGGTLRNDNGLGVPLESITAFPSSVTGGVFVGGSPAMPLSVYELNVPGTLLATADDMADLDGLFADNELLDLLLADPLTA